MNTKKARVTKPIRTYAALIQAPEGWVRKEVEDRIMIDGSPYDAPGTLEVTVSSEDVEVIFRIHKKEYGRQKGKVEYSGTTRFKKDGQWYSFDRRGVSDTFYSPFEGELPDPAKVIEEERKRVADYLSMDAQRIDVPSFTGFSGYRLSPEAKAEYTRKLKAGRIVTFTPAGFGIGHQFGVNKSRNGWGSWAPQELADFFGVPRLWHETFDHD